MEDEGCKRIEIMSNWFFYVFRAILFQLLLHSYMSDDVYIEEVSALKNNFKNRIGSEWSETYSGITCGDIDRREEIFMFSLLTNHCKSFISTHNNFHNLRQSSASTWHNHFRLIAMTSSRWSHRNTTLFFKLSRTIIIFCAEFMLTMNLIHVCLRLKHNNGSWKSVFIFILKLENEK